MAAKPRSKQTLHLPEHVYYDARRGSYRIKLIDGKYKSLGVDREVAIAIAKEYNRVARPKVGLAVESLLDSGYVSDEKCFGDHVDDLLKRILHEEQPSETVAKVMRNDAERCKAFFAQVPSSVITLQHVNDYLNQFHPDTTPEVHNKKVSWLKKIFSYAVDEGLMSSNPASLKKRKRLDKKQRQRLKVEWYQQIHEAAPLWLQTAMDLSLQTTHARLEISRIRYNIKTTTSKTCGCYWFKTPEITPFGKVYGTLYIHRQKVEKKEAANVAIPIGETLKGIIDRSRDNLVSNFVVHRLPKKCSNELSKEVTHLTQLTPDYISRSFSKIRDEVGCCNHLPKPQRPTFHEIRALAAHLFGEQGIDPQSRMAHTDAKSTKIYMQNHIEWVEVPYGEIKIG